ncbi:MAG: glutamate mutase L [Proteobacteria bacterium]|jgi:uncharacterized protein (TIGR01319 family)|nr:glutamate mutase L [Pseudomonadota bacterium]
MSIGPPSVIAITDCGSTTTKAILVERKGGVFRQTFRGEAPTTVEAPVEDVTVGVVAALRDLSARAGRRIVDDAGAIVRPASGGDGVDLYLSTSSAGGGLQMVVAGVVAKLSARSAQRAALGAGAIVADVVACDDDRTPYERIARLKRLRPDIVLLAGGTDGGAEIGVVEMAQLIAAADPKPRFGGQFTLPVVFAGNARVAAEVARVLKGKAELYAVANVRPSIEQERLEPARERIHDLFLDHVMQQAPGFSKLLAWTDAPVMPTPSAVGAILRLASEREKLDVLAVDIGGATTDVFSVVSGAFNRTVSANLGVSYSAAFVLAEAGVENVRRWLPYRMSGEDLRDAVMNKTIRPTTIPADVEDLMLEQALAREALRLSFAQHAEFATGLAGKRVDRSFDENLSSGRAEEGGLRTMAIDLLVGSGGVLAHAPRAAQTAAMLVDSFGPAGVTRIAKDSIFMLPHLGVLSQLDPRAAREVLENDCIVVLGTCVAPAGAVRPGKPCLEFSLERADGTSERGALSGGEIVAVPLAAGEEAELVVSPRRGLDVGAGASKSWRGRVRGGEVGLILDCRGRPFVFARDDHERIAAQRRWLGALGAFEGGG